MSGSPTSACLTSQHFYREIGSNCSFFCHTVSIQLFFLEICGWGVANCLKRSSPNIEEVVPP